MIVYTAVYGAYDFLHPHPNISDVEWRCYTDDPDISPNGWEIVVEAPRYAHPRMSAKWRKCHPPLDHDMSLWIDGCVEVTHEDFVEQFYGLLNVRHPIALWRHPQRSRVRDEALFSVGLPKYLDLDMIGQVERYWERRNDLDSLGLYASTVIGRLHTPEVLQMGAAWLAHCDLSTYQDQLSLPVLLADYGIEPAIIPESLVHASGFMWRWGDHRSQL